MSADSDALPHTPAAEDSARANFYGLLARLFYAPPDRALLAALAGADELAVQDNESALALAWRALKAQAAAGNEESVREEFDTLYIGTGKAQVSPYAGAYLEHSRAARQLVALRQYLTQRTLGRQPGVNEPEDHIAALCDVMRHLIIGEPHALAAQQEFFTSFVWPQVVRFCDATEKAECSKFYGFVARFARSFLELEHEIFESELTFRT